MRNARILLLILLFQGMITSTTVAQDAQEINRIEFNSGTRTYREQTILTPDSIRTIKEDFRTDLKPRVSDRTMTQREWSALINSLDQLRLTEIETLQSPTMKRTFDGAAHGSLIITTRDGKTYTHGFDNEDPHKKLKPLMDAIRRVRKK